MVHSSSRRRFSAALLAAIAGVLLAGDGAAAKERVLISTVRGFYNTAMDEIAAQYMELNPDVEIEINLQPDNYTITRYYTANMAADRATAPDIVHGNLLGVDQNFHMDRFLAVNDYLQRPNPYAGNVVWMDLFDPDLIRSMAVDGIHYCVIPLDFCDAAVYYNKDIFDRYGLKPPSTWDEWIEVCTVLEEHDILPIAVSGSTQTDFTGWIDLMFEDACMRPFTPEIIARPGDWNYVEANDHYVHDLSNKDSDRYITINPERLISAVLDGTISYEMPHFVDAYSQFQTLTPHFAFGFLGTDQAGAYNLFLTGRAAMWQTGSWRVGSLMKDLRELPEEMRFDWAVFPFPDLREAHEDIAPLRGVGGVGHQFCVVNKFDPAQHDRVIDFMMYLYTPEKVAYLIRRTLEVGEFIQGMPMVKGAEKELPVDILDKLKGFGGRGYTNPGLFLNDEEYDKRIRPWYQLYALGRVTVEEFLAQKQALAIELMHRQIARRGFDLDPTTDDKAL